MINVRRRVCDERKRFPRVVEGKAGTMVLKHCRRMSKSTSGTGLWCGSAESRV